MAFGLVFYSYARPWLDRLKGRWRPVITGLVFGGLAVVLMISRIQVADGVSIDARLVPIALIALVEGGLAGLAPNLLSRALARTAKTGIYLVRDVPRDLQRTARARAVRDGTTLRWVLLQALRTTRRDAGRHGEAPSDVMPELVAVVDLDRRKR